MNLSLEHPGFLVLLVALPIVLVTLRFTLADSPRAQLFLSAAVRCVLIALLILALASLLWVTPSRRVSLVVLGDVSDSVPKSAPGQLAEWWRRVSAAVPDSAQVGWSTFAVTNQEVVPLGGKAGAVEEPPRHASAGATDLERASLNTAVSMPTDTLNRLLLVSDGNETVGDALAAARRAARHGWKVYAAAYTNEVRDEVLLEDLVVPNEVKKGASFAVAAITQASAPTRAQFTLYRDGFEIQKKEVDLVAGPNTLSFQETRAKEGLVKYELRMKAARDFFADNNVASGLVSVAGEPRVLLLEGIERDARFLARALEAENIRVEVREGKGMPGSLEELAAYDAVIVSDVPATDLRLAQMNLIRSYVEDLGGGFIMIGGPNSFGIGGYYRTPVEEALPIRMRSEKKKDTPGLAMMLVIDKSGSMSGDKIQLAKEAAIAAVELLSDRDYVGVIAFDGEPYVVAELQPASNKGGIIANIERIEEGGGTAMYEPMVRAHEQLQQVTAALKHCIVLTDGVSQPGDFQGITQAMQNDQITVSSVGIGQGDGDIDTEVLQNIARWGRGRFYQTSDPQDVPQIFTKETMTASKSSLVEDPFLPQVLRNDPVVRGIDWNNAPFLFGYVVTLPKPTAGVALLTERGDPLLATWRFGLGKSAAFMSDAKGRWAADWVRWPGYGQFWAQLVRDVMRTTQHRGAETTLAVRGGEGHLRIDATDPAGAFMNGLTTTAQLIQPDLSLRTLPLAQTAPGRYEATFPMPATGSYLFKIRQTRPGVGAGAEPELVNDYTRALTVSYQPEYRHLSANEAFLRTLATSTGGRFDPTVEDLFRVDPEEQVPVRRRLWPWLLTAALVLLVLDVALRRLDLAGRGLFKPDAQRYG